MPRPARPNNTRQVTRRWLRAIAAVAVLVLIGAGLWFRPGFTPPTTLFDGGHSIADLEEVRLSGGDQWVSIRGQDRSKPVLLMMLGDSDMPQIAFARGFQRPLERDFVVVQWDRAGSGKSFDPNAKGPAPHEAREVEDAIQLIGFLQRRLGARRVILLGHDEGSLVAAAVAQARPDLVRAYVGVGQRACTIQDERAIQDSWLRKAAALADDNRTRQEAAASGDWNRGPALARYGGLGVGAWAAAPPMLLAFLAPEYTLPEAVALHRSAKAPSPAADGPALPLARSIPALEVPAFFFIGHGDYVAPWLCAERYASAVEAPLKRVVWFEGSAHDPFLDEPAAFRRELLKIAAETADRL